MSYKWKIVLVAISGTFMMMIDATIVNIALPHILAVFNDNISRGQFVTSAYLMATAISAPAASYLGSKFGMKRVYLASQLTFLAGSVLCGLAWSTNSLIFFRIIQGLAGGLLMPLAMTLIFTNVPKEERGTAMGMLGIPMILAPTIGTTLGGYLVEFADWRMCFYVNVPIVVIAFFVGLAWIIDTPKKANLPLDWKGYILAAVGFGTILYGLSYVPSWGWSDTRIIVLFTVGIVSMVSWVFVELREKVPILDIKVFKYRGYSLGTFLNFIITMGLFSSMFMMPLFLQNIRGMGAFESGLLLIPQAMGAVVGTIVGGRFYDKIGPRPPVMLGLLITGLATLQLGRIDTTTADSTLRWILAFRGVGMGFAMMPVTTFALAEVPMYLTSQASSINNVARSVFSSLGTAIFASMLTSFQKDNLATMMQTVGQNSITAVQTLAGIQVGLQKTGMSVDAAHQTALTLLYQLTTVRSYVAAFDTAFLIGGVVILAAIIPAFFLYDNASKKAQAANGGTPAEKPHVEIG